jgi:hypothetical protein
MSGTTDFLPFATAVGANVESQASWAADGALGPGFSAGLAASTKFNKAIRQPSFVGAGLATWIAQTLAINVPDDGNLANFVGFLNSSVSAVAVAASTTTFYADTGAVNAIAVTLSPVPSSYTSGLKFRFQIGATNTSATVNINVNGLGNKRLKVDEADPQIGALVLNTIYEVIYDGTVFQLQAPVAAIPASTTQAGIALLAQQSDATTGTDVSKIITPGVMAQAIQKNSFTYATAGGTANALTLTLAPVPASLYTGMAVEFLAPNANTGAATLNVNGLGAKPIISAGAALTANAILLGVVYSAVYDGTSFHLQSQLGATITSYSYGATNNWEIYSNGKIRQWGFYAVASGSETSYTVTLPLALPNGCYGMPQASVTLPGATTTNDWTAQPVSTSVNTSGGMTTFVVMMQLSNSGNPYSGFAWSLEGH